MHDDSINDECEAASAKDPERYAKKSIDGVRDNM